MLKKVSKTVSNKSKLEKLAEDCGFLFKGFLSSETYDYDLQDHNDLEEALDDVLEDDEYVAIYQLVEIKKVVKNECYLEDVE